MGTEQSPLQPRHGESCPECGICPGCDMDFRELRAENERLRDVARMALGVANDAMQEFDYRRGAEESPDAKATYTRAYREARELFDAAWEATR